MAKPESGEEYDTVYLSPEKVKYENKEKLDAYLRSNPGGPDSSAFDWSIFQPRRSGRIRNSKQKATESPEGERQNKRVKGTEGEKDGEVVPSASSGSAESSKKVGPTEPAAPEAGIQEERPDEAQKGDAKVIPLTDKGKEDINAVEKTSDAALEEEDMHALENSVDAAPEEEDMHALENSVDAAPEEEDMHAIENSVDAAPEEEEKDDVHVLDKTVYAAPEEEDMHALENSVDAALEEEEKCARVDQGKSEPKPNDSEMLSNESAPKVVEETHDAYMLADDAPAPDQETRDGGEVRPEDGFEDGFEDSYAGSALPQQRHGMNDKQHHPTASPVNC